MLAFPLLWLNFANCFWILKSNNFFYSLCSLSLFSLVRVCSLLPSPPSGAFLPSQERCMRLAAQPAFCKPVCTPGPWCCASLLNNGDKLILETPNKLSLLLLFHYVPVDWEGLVKWFGVGELPRGMACFLKERWEALALITLTQFLPLYYPLWLYLLCFVVIVFCKN